MSDQQPAAPTADAALQPQEQLIMLQPEKYFFKKDKLGNRRPTLEIPTPKATVNLVAHIYNEGGKGLDLLLECMNSVFVEHVRLQLNDDTKPVLEADKLDYSKLDWDYIAKIPPAERKGVGIAAEVWEAFAADYVLVMTGRIERTAEQIAAACALFVKRLAPVKWRKPVLSQLQNYLKLWYANTTEQDQFTEVYKFLDGKITEFLALDEDAAAMNI